MKGRGEKRREAFKSRWGDTAAEKPQRSPRSLSDSSL
jgi:hypothetical protein